MPRKGPQWKEPAFEKWVDPDPGNFKDPQNEPIGIAENNRRAEQTDAAIEQFEDRFFPKPPPPRRPSSCKKMSTKKKKARFLLSFNARGGNVSYGLLESGLTRKEFRGFADTDQAFREALEEIKLVIADRAKYCLSEKIGLVKSRVGITRVADNLLLQTVKALDKEMFNDDGAGTITVRIEIPRPGARESRDAGLPAVPAPADSPRLTS